MAANCRYCGEEIWFQQNAGGKYMPVNHALLETYYIFARRDGPNVTTFMLENGQLIRGAFAKSTDNGTTQINAWHLHFDTCVGRK